MRLRTLVRRFTVVGVLACVAAAPAAALAETPSDRTPAASRQPVFHRSQHSGVEVGRVMIPNIGVDEVVRSGVAIEVIDLGVAHWSGTARPGQPGNMVLAGHRSTHSQPFQDLDRLRPGDLIYVRDGRGFDVMYRVEESFVVDPTAIWITYDRPDPSLTLFACHPKGSSAQRIVVTAGLVGGGRIS